MNSRDEKSFLSGIDKHPHSPLTKLQEMASEFPMSAAISLDHIKDARLRIRNRVNRTPVIRASGLSTQAEGAVYLKLEGFQPTGSFKIRGAFNKILSLTSQELRRGVVTFSTGNHGRATAYAARELGATAAICMSRNVPEFRLKAIAQYGAEVFVHGSSQDEAEAFYERLQVERDLVPVVPFDDPFVIAGQGTIGLELLDDIPELDTVVVPVSGGGLVSGVALALKSMRPCTRIIAVSTARSPVLQQSVKESRTIRMPEQDTLADALLGGLGSNNRFTLRLAADLVDEWISVDEAQIAAAMHYAAMREGVVAEGAGAVGLAAVLSGYIAFAGRNTAVLVTGRNVAAERLGQVIAL